MIDYEREIKSLEIFDDPEYQEFLAGIADKPQIQELLRGARPKIDPAEVEALLDEWNDRR